MRFDTNKPCKKSSYSCTLNSMKSAQKNEDIGSFKIESLQELKKEGKFFILHWFDFIMLSFRKELKQKPKEFLLLFTLGVIISIAFFSFLIYGFMYGISVNLSLPTFSAPNFAQFQILSSGRNNPGKVFDPVLLISKIKKNDTDYVLIDVRGKDEYEKGHITTSISIPVFGTDMLQSDGSVDSRKIKNAFKGRTDKKIVILYGHTAYSSFPHQVAEVLDKSGKKVKVLGIGWNEWAHFKSLWVPESLWGSIDENQFVQLKEE